MLDHVEGVGRVEVARHLDVEVPDRRREAALGQAPAQVRGARVVEVGELDLVAGLEQREAVRADAAPVVEHPRPGLDQADQLVQIGQLRPRHRERGQVVEVGLGAAVEGVLVAAGRELALELELVLLQPPELEALAEVLLELSLLARGRELERRHRGHDSGGPPAEPVATLAA